MAKVRMVVMTPVAYVADYTGPAEGMDEWCRVHFASAFTNYVQSGHNERGPVDGVYRPKLMEAVLREESIPKDPLEDIIAPGQAA